jgi:hypothetical protein
VVGPPPGLAPIGTTAGLSQAQLAAAQQLPSRPATPVGTATTGAVAAMRRSISGGWHGTHTLSPCAAAMLLACCCHLLCQTLSQPCQLQALRILASSVPVAPTTPHCLPPSF